MSDPLGWGRPDRRRAVDPRTAGTRTAGRMDTVLFPQDADFEALCRAVGVNPAFDAEAADVVLRHIARVGGIGDGATASALESGASSEGGEGDRDDAVKVLCCPVGPEGRGNEGGKTQSQSKVYFARWTTDAAGKRSRVLERTHPNVAACKAAYAAALREKLRNENAQYLEMEGREQQGEEKLKQAAVARKNAIVAKAKVNALLHYKAALGDPEVDDVAPAGRDRLRFWQVSPADVKRCAKFTFDVDLAKEPALAWVVRQFLVCEMAPGWSQECIGEPWWNRRYNANSTTPISRLVELDAGSETEDGDRTDEQDDCFMFSSPSMGADNESPVLVDEHPAKSYFLSLIAAVREENELVSDGIDVDGHSQENSQDIATDPGEESDEEEESDDEEEEEGSDEDNEEHASESESDEEDGDEEPFRRGVLWFWDFAERCFYVYNFRKSLVIDPNETEGFEDRPDTRCLAKVYANDSDAESAPEIKNDEAEEEKPTSESLVPIRWTPHFQTLEALESFVESAPSEELWRKLSTSLDPIDLESFATFVGVTLENDRTEFLQEIARSLLGPLPDGWVRATSPEGVDHFCNTVPRLIDDVWRIAANPKSSDVSLPRWVHTALERGHPVVLVELECSMQHPLAETCKRTMIKRRRQIERDKERTRIQQRQNNSEHIQVVRNQLWKRTDAEIDELAGDPLHGAFKYFSERFGAVEAPGEVRREEFSKSLTPPDIFRMAREMGINSEQAGLFWIPHMRLCLELPPGWIWRETAAVFVHEPTLFQCTQHPAHGYCEALLRVSRETGFVPENGHQLQMTDEDGKLYLYDFKTKERLPLAPKLRRSFTVKGKLSSSSLSFASGCEHAPERISEVAVCEDDQADETEVTFSDLLARDLNADGIEAERSGLVPPKDVLHLYQQRSEASELGVDSLQYNLAESPVGSMVLRRQSFRQSFRAIGSSKSRSSSDQIDVTAKPSTVSHTAGDSQALGLGSASIGDAHVSWEQASLLDKSSLDAQHLTEGPRFWISQAENTETCVVHINLKQPQQQQQQQQQQDGLQPPPEGRVNYYEHEWSTQQETGAVDVQDTQPKKKRAHKRRDRSASQPCSQEVPKPSQAEALPVHRFFQEDVARNGGSRLPCSGRVLLSPVSGSPKTTVQVRTRRTELESLISKARRNVDVPPLPVTSRTRVKT